MSIIHYLRKNKLRRSLIKVVMYSSFTCVINSHNYSTQVFVIKKNNLKHRNTQKQHPARGYRFKHDAIRDANFQKIPFLSMFCFSYDFEIILKPQT